MNTLNPRDASRLAYTVATAVVHAFHPKEKHPTFEELDAQAREDLHAKTLIARDHGVDNVADLHRHLIDTKTHKLDTDALFDVVFARTLEQLVK